MAPETQTSQGPQERTLSKQLTSLETTQWATGLQLCESSPILEWALVAF